MKQSILKKSIRYMKETTIFGLVGKIFLAVFIGFYSVNAKSDIVNDVLSDGDTLKELRDIIADIGLNCASPQMWPMALNELRTILTGISRIVSEQTQTLLYKRDYPTVCHVLTESHIDSYQVSMGKTGESEIRNGVVTTKAKHYQPQPVYYWPKYFIEVSSKGNDSHKSFAKNNLIYGVNRKIANALSAFLDLDGSVGLASKLLGTSLVAENLSSSLGVKIAGHDNAQLMRAGVLAPFEKMRIRANSQDTSPSYDVNIWPVGLSEAVGTELSVCGSEYQKRGMEIGYSWPFKGIPMTCPVAMSKDAYAFWDTGLIDYLDPQALASIKTVADPLACGVAQASYALASQGKAKSSPIGDQSKIDGATGKLTETLSKAIRPCSWPILGAAEGIARKAASLTSAAKWKGPYCTIWGSLAPRSSTSVYQNDYSMANAALKFKLLSHELFGTPRAEQERWSLAYPWEGKGADIGSSNFLKDFNLDLIEDLKTLKRVEGSPIDGKIDELGITNDGGSRSDSLMLPGDPRLMDASSYDLVDGIKNFAKELGYLSALLSVGDEAARQAERAYMEEFGEKPESSEEMRNRMDREIRRAEDESAHLEEEVVYDYRNYCHVSEEKHGTIRGEERYRFNVRYSGYVRNGGSYKFIPMGSKSECHSQEIGGCVTQRADGTCRKKRKAQFVFYKRLVKVGTRRVKHPKIFKIVQEECKVKHHSTATKKRDFVTCRDRLATVDQIDTRQYAGRPNPQDGRSITERDDTAAIISNVARASAMASAEIARAKLSDISGNNPLPGKKRVYTIWEKIQCTYPSIVKKWQLGPVKYSTYDSCESAVRFKVKEFVQLKLLRKICDSLGQKEGDPFK